MTLLTQNVWRGLFFGFAILSLLMATGCKDDENADPEPGTNVELRPGDQLGEILVDGNGMTLYFFTRDADGSSACTGACLDAWPVFYEEDLNVGQGLNESDFGSIDRGGGEMQTTYKGWPLYYFANDAQAGDVNGDGANSNTWFAAKPDYDLMIATQPVEDGGDEVHYLVDAEGNTLYLFLNDVNGVSACVDGCLENWPLFDQEGNLTFPSALSESAFARISRDDGENQLAYRGWPLYYFNNDADRGDVNGHGAASGLWFVVEPDVETAPEEGGESGAILLEEHETHGQYLVDEEGRTLYFFSNDVDGASACTSEGCLGLWPVFYRENPEIGEGLDSDDFDVIERSDGEMQTTYKGWPLYYYAGDNAAGDVNGESINYWPVAKPNYTIMLSRQAVEGEGEPVAYLVDAAGNTLYLFENDKNGMSSCTSEACVGNWPIFYADNLTIPSYLSEDDFGSIDRGDGEMQTTYKGWPLYYFTGDGVRGEVKGHSINNWAVMEMDEAPAPEE